MEQLPHREEALEVPEKEDSVRYELLARADEAVAQAVHELSVRTEAELETLTHFELNGREWKIEDADDRVFAMELRLLEGVRDIADRETDYYRKKGLLKVFELQQSHIEILRRTIELKRDWPLVAAQMEGREQNR